MELPFPQKFQRRQPGLQSPDEIGPRLDRFDTIATQLEFGREARVENVQVSTVRQYRLDSNFTAWAAHDVTDGQCVPTVPTTNKQPRPVSVNRCYLETYFAHAKPSSVQ